MSVPVALNQLEPSEPIVAGGYWTTSWHDDDGNRHRKRFGNALRVTRAVAMRRYQNFLSMWRRSAALRAPERGPVTIAKLVDDYLAHSKTYYRRADGEQSGEAEQLYHALKVLRDVAGDKEPADVVPADLILCQDRMVDSGLARSTINGRINRIRRFFKWLTIQGYVRGLMQDLAAVPPLKFGRTTAKEPEPVRPVHESIMRETMEYMPQVVRDMVELHWLTGMRSGELVIMRWADIDKSGPVWIYRPQRHKTQHHGRKRAIFLGPKSQAILNRYPRFGLEDFIFSPRDANEERDVARRAARQTPRTPSQLARDERTSSRGSGLQRYTPYTYRQAIEYACLQAFPLPPELAPRQVPNADGRGTKTETRTRWWARLSNWQREKVQAWQRAHRWHPHQLRHACATRLRKEFGLEQARIILGHASMDTTEIYAELDSDEARRIMSKVG